MNNNGVGRNKPRQRRFRHSGGMLPAMVGVWSGPFCRKRSRGDLIPAYDWKLIQNDS